MRVVKAFDFYDIVYVKYVQQYWIINRQQDVKEGEGKNLPESIALAEALDGALKRFIIESEEENE